MYVQANTLYGLDHSENCFWMLNGIPRVRNVWKAVCVGKHNKYPCHTDLVYISIQWQIKLHVQIYDLRYTSHGKNESLRGICIFGVQNVYENASIKQKVNKPTTVNRSGGYCKTGLRIPPTEWAFIYKKEINFAVWRNITASTLLAYSIRNGNIHQNYCNSTHSILTYIYP
jgi:hypothetical protein